LVTKATEVERDNTLLTGGCSFVWGDELEGYDRKHPVHWEHTFTHKVAKKLGLEPNIIAECGNGNDKIFRDIVQYINNPEKPLPAMVFVSWSAFKRIELFEMKEDTAEADLKIKRWQNMSQFSPERFKYLNKSNQQIAELWSNLAYNQETGALHMVTYAIALQLICDGLGIKLMQTVFHNRMGQSIGDMLNPKTHYRDSQTHYGLFSDWLETELARLRPENRLGFYNVDSKTGLSNESDWFDMYWMAVQGNKAKKETDPFYGCKVKEFMHPCENTHTVYSDQIVNLTKKLNWKFS